MEMKLKTIKAIEATCVCDKLHFSYCRRADSIWEIIEVES